MGAEARRSVPPGGLVGCEVPNFNSWQARLTRNRWFHLDVPRHLVHYTSYSVKALLARHGLQLARQHTFSMEMGPFGMLQSILNIVGLSPNWLFRWLKRSVPSPSHKAMLLNLVATTAAIVPASFLEIAALTVRGGGIIRVFAIRKVNYPAASCRAFSME